MTRGWSPKRKEPTWSPMDEARKYAAHPERERFVFLLRVILIAIVLIGLVVLAILSIVHR